MHLLMTTFAFLMIFAIFSYAQFQKLSETTFTERLYTARFKQENDALSDSFSKRAIELLSPHSSTERDDDSNTNGKCTRYLHIDSLIQRDEVALETEESKAAKSLLKQLIVTLYGTKTFFLEAGMDTTKIDALVELMFRNAKELANKNYLKDIKVLANVGLNNEIYQEVLYKMLKGTAVDQQNDDPLFKKANNYKSLCQFVRFQRRIKNPAIMSVYLAPNELLVALFQDPDVVANILARRKEFFKKLQADTEKKIHEEQLATDFANEFQSQIPVGIDKNLIDFKVSRTDPNKYSEGL